MQISVFVSRAYMLPTSTGNISGLILNLENSGKFKKNVVNSWQIQGILFSCGQKTHLYCFIQVEHSVFLLRYMTIDIISSCVFSLFISVLIFWYPISS